MSILFRQEFGAADRLGHALRFRARLFLVLPWKDHYIFVTAVPHEAVFLIKNPMNRLRHLSQHFCAEQMPMSIDDFLEIIEIKEYQRHCLFARSWRSEQAVEISVQITRIIESCHVIRDR